MNLDQKIILLNARQQALRCLEACLAQAYKFPIEKANTWWLEARDKAAEIDKLRAEIKAEKDRLRKEQAVA